MIFKLIFFLFFILEFNFLHGSFFTNYKAKNAYFNDKFKNVIEILEKKQVDNPDDPIINYNLGTTYYKLNEFDKAKSNLQRSIKNCLDDNIELKEKAYFNWANSFYKSCLNILGPNWEKKETNNQILDLALKEIKQAIEKYRNCLVLNKENKRAIFNKKKAEEILKKLEEKKKKNEQKENNQENQQQSQQKDKQDKKKKNEDSKEKKNHSDKGQQESSQEKNKNNQSQKSEQQNKRKDTSKKTENNGDKGDDKNFENKKSNQEKQDMNERKQEYSSQKNDEQKKEQASKKEDKHQEEKNQESNFNNKNAFAKQAKQNGEKNDVKSKMLRLMLDDLQNDEANLQKALIKYKTKGEKLEFLKGQKPW
ncbi:hypothetical protein GF385_02480 [Candidatus Dependentiae bacterium]|nr:hypothetical protein [Candidatus Dependentiae bacterium]